VKKIVLLCAGGMSTSLLLNKMKEAAEKRNYECEISAQGVYSSTSKGLDADIILLAPQVRFQQSEISKNYPSIPVIVLEMVDYGMMNGEKILNQTIEALEKK
jgi:cellobiose PTS system EIIB component